MSNTTELEPSIINNVIEFVKSNRENLETNYSKAKRSLRKNYIKNISYEEYINKLVKVSIVILTANEFEENVLNYSAYIDQEDPINNPILEVDQKITFKNPKIEFNAYLLKINSYDVLHLHAKNTGSYTTGGSADLVRYVAENEYIHPTCIISFGVCFGHSYTEQNLGDTIIAEKLYPYFIGVKLTDGALTVKSDEFILPLKESSKLLYDKLENLIRNGDLESNNLTGIEGDVHVGNLITGEAVISDATYKKTFECAAHSINPLGGEMEGYGLGKECLFYNIPCMLIKSICDWAVAKNIDNQVKEATMVSKSKDKIQSYTAYCAYTVLKKLFTEHIFEKSLYSKLKEHFINMCKSGIGCYLPYSEIEEEILSHRFNSNSKLVTPNYIKMFCGTLVNEGVWVEKCTTKKGYIILNKGEGNGQFKKQ